MTHPNEADRSDEGPPQGVPAMAIRRWILIVLMASVAAGCKPGGAGTAEPGTKGSAQPAGGSGAHAGHRHDPSDPYRCPMHPEETGKDASARCPICGMKLERVQPNPSTGQEK